MNIKNNYFILLTLIFTTTFGFYFFSLNKTNTNFNKKEQTINTELKVYNKGVEKINYETTMTGIIIEKFTKNKDIFLSGSILYIDGKTYSGAYLNVFDTKLKKNKDEFQIDYYVGNSIKNNTNSGATQTGSLNKKKYNLTFLNGFSKMKLLGKEYNFNKNNILFEDTYDIQFFLSKDKAFVIEFENSKENKIRKERFNDYSKKINEIKTKYWNDPYTANKLVNELNKTYNIQISKLK